MHHDYGTWRMSDAVRADGSYRNTRKDPASTAAHDKKSGFLSGCNESRCGMTLDHGQVQVDLGMSSEYAFDDLG